MSRIFISYRRSDSADFSGRLYDRLSQHFGDENVFMDIDTIEPGLDFVEVIEKAVGSCDVLIVVIGKQWLTITDAAGRRRLDDPEDFVRLEVQTALDRNVRVIPALISSATMPQSHELPDALKKLTRRNAIPISPRFHPEVDELIEVIEKVLGSARGSTPAKSASKWQEERQDFEPELILIPAGEFLMGSDPQKDKKAYEDEIPQHKLYLPDYFIAKTLVTNAQYAVFVQATNYQTQAEKAGKSWVWKDGQWQEVNGTNWQHPTGPGNDISQKSHHPVVQVSWYDALAYCEWLAQVTGKAYHLPTEAEWEKAARGGDGRIYPWGNEWDAKRCNTYDGGRNDTTPVETYPTGASPYGLLDMAGNVREWTLSLWGTDMDTPAFNYPYNAHDGREELNEEMLRVLRGGSFGNYQDDVRCAGRERYDPNFRSSGTGFRVAVSPIQ